MPTDSEFANMELFVKAMKPIVDIIEVLGAQKYVCHHFYVRTIVIQAA